MTNIFKSDFVEGEQSQVYVHVPTGHLAVNTHGKVIKGQHAPATVAAFNRHTEIAHYANLEDAPGDWECLGDL